MRRMDADVSSRRSPACRAAMIALVIAAAGAACDGADRRVAGLVAAAGPAAVEAGVEVDRDPYSNILAADYVGPDACGDCHDDQHGTWRTSLHAAMNQLAAPGAVLGDFAGARLRYGGGTARFERDGDGFTMTLARDGGRARRWRVTRTIGSRYLQEYVGVLLDGPEPAGDARYTTEVRLPFGWWVRRGGWMPQPFFDSWFDAEYAEDGALGFDPYAPPTEPWATRCAWCHNTYPFELRVTRHDGGDQLGQGPERHVGWQPGVAPRADAAAIVADNLLPIAELVTVGISCESCHLGGRAHAGAEAPAQVAPRFAPSSPALWRGPDAPDPRTARDDPAATTAICAQCHSTPAPRYPGGAAVRNSSEALDLGASACAQPAREVPAGGRAITCIDCHDPHVAGPGPGAADRPDHLAACTGCHAALAAPDAARAHARHDDVACLDCHMPRIVQGISAFVRTHRIAVPVEPALAAIGAPNACNLCHLDRPITWTLDALATGWGVRLAPEDDWAVHYGGDLATPVGEAWLTSPVRTYKIAAAAAYARAPDPEVRRGAVPRLLAGLDDARAFYRMFMLFALEDARGRRLSPAEYDPLAPPARRAAQLCRLTRSPTACAR